MRSMMLGIVLVGCSDYRVAPAGPAADAGPDIQVEPERVHFGEIPYGDAAAAELTVHNRGISTLELSTLKLDGPSSFTVGELGDPVRVSAGDSLTLSLGLSPLQALEEAVLVIVSDDPDTPELSVPLEGVGLIPELSVTPATLQFEFAEDDCEDVRTLTLENTGTGTLQVDAMAAVGSGYTLDPAEVLGSYAPGEQRSVEVQSANGGDGSLWITSNDPRGDQVLVLDGPLDQVVAYADGDIELVSLAAGCDGSETVVFDRLSDCGSGEVTLDSASFAGDDFVLVWPESLPHAYAATEPVEIEVAAAYGGVGTVRDTLSLDFDGSLEALELAVRAHLGTQSLQILPDPVDLGTWPLGCPISAEVELTNSSSCPVLIDEITVSGADFDLDGLPTPPVLLDTWESVAFDVYWATESTGSADETIEASFEGHTLATAPVSVKVGDTEVEDRFIRDGPFDEVDVLVYVDGSCSMTDDTDRLANQAEHFVASLEDLDEDWQIGVVSEKAGCLDATIRPSDSDPSGDFQAAVSATMGTPNELGLSTTLKAIEQGGSGDCNEGFFREGAGLHGILVSDEPEQSPTNWSTLVADMQALEPSIMLSAIAGDFPAGCATANAGDGYYQAVGATAGQFHSICTPDWTGLVTSLATSVSSDPDAPYPLSQVPEVDTIVVEVAGVSSSDWSYDHVEVALNFVEGTVQSGEEVVVSYTARCPEDSP